MDRLLLSRHRLVPAGLVLFAFLLLLGCGGQPEEAPTEAPDTPTPTAEVEAEAEQALPSPEPSETPQPTPTPRPTNTPFPASITADYQIVDREGMITVEEITLPDDGWLVVYPDRRTPLEADDALGFVIVAAGRQQNVSVEINPQWPERTVQLALHGGRASTSEGLEAVSAANLLVIETLAIDTLATLPEIEVVDQAIMEDGIVEVDRVSIGEPGWVGIYPAEDDHLKQLLGFAPLPAGDSDNIPVPIRWREAPTRLKAVVLEDLGEIKTFEPEIDRPFKILDDDLQTAFSVVFPPDIVIFNQPVVDSRFIIERAATPVDGWIVIYEDGDEDGQPGFIIGSAMIKQGVNEQVEIEVNDTAVVDQLLVTFHEDTGEVGVFDFPGADPPQRYQQQAFFTTFRTDQGSTIMTRNQAVEAGSITIPLVITNIDCWVVIYDDVDGQPGDTPLGLTWVPPGFNREIVVELENDPAGSIIHAVIHVDNGDRREFEPEITDFPLQFNRRPVAAQFEIQP